MRLKVMVAVAVVPNVPCGVESRFISFAKARTPFVPNVPCGVESALKL